MRIPSYGNRGKTFESFIEYANSRYRQDKTAIVEKQYVEMLPIRNGYGQIINCKIGEKSTVDYIGRYKGYPIAIEAKNTNSGYIRFDAVQRHQAAFLNDFTSEQGTIGLVLLSFNLRRFYAVPWPFWSVAYDIRVKRNDRKTKITLHAFGEAWNIPQKYSVREADLLPEWEIKGNDPKYGLHYLKNVKKYIVKSKETL